MDLLGNAMRNIGRKLIGRSATDVVAFDGVAPKAPRYPGGAFRVRYAIVVRSGSEVGEPVTDSSAAARSARRSGHEQQALSPLPSTSAESSDSDAAPASGPSTGEACMLPTAAWKAGCGDRGMVLMPSMMSTCCSVIPEEGPPPSQRCLDVERLPEPKLACPRKAEQRATTGFSPAPGRAGALSPPRRPPATPRSAALPSHELDGEWRLQSELSGRPSRWVAMTIRGGVVTDACGGPHRLEYGSRGSRLYGAGLRREGASMVWRQRVGSQVFTRRLDQPPGPAEAP